MHFRRFRVCLGEYPLPHAANVINKDQLHKACLSKNFDTSHNYIVAWMLKDAKSIFLDAGERSCWRLVHFWSILTIFQSFFGGTVYSGVQPGVPSHLVTWHDERVERWRPLGAALDDIGLWLKSPKYHTDRSTGSSRRLNNKPGQQSRQWGDPSPPTFFITWFAHGVLPLSKK